MCKLRRIIGLEGFKENFNSILNFFDSYVCSFDRNTLICVLAKCLKHVDVVAGYNRKKNVISARNPQSRNSGQK